jgi:regulator of sigma E protease
MPTESPNILVTLGAFLLLLGSLVIVHELGHYLVGRWFGVKAEKFSIGFGPQIWGRVDKRGTLWRVAALPLGGYVQFAGDLNPTSQTDEAWKELPDAERNKTFPSKPLWQRALIIFAGPGINFLFAILIFAGFAYAFGERVTPALVETVVPNSPAEKAGLAGGDRIVSFDGHQIDGFDDLVGEVTMVPNERVDVVVERNGNLLTKNILIAERIEKDRFGNVYRLGMLGIPPADMEIRDVGLIESPIVGVRTTIKVLRQQMKGLGQILTGRRPVSELGGPLKIAKISGEAMSLGILAFVTLAALISINLGFINLLPIPMLDGGHLLLYAVEAVRRRPATPQVQEWAFRAGFVMLIGFMLMVTFNDLASFGLFGR